MATEKARMKLIYHNEDIEIDKKTLIEIKATQEQEEIGPGKERIPIRYLIRQKDIKKIASQNLNINSTQIV